MARARIFLVVLVAVSVLTGVPTARADARVWTSGGPQQAEITSIAVARDGSHLYAVTDQGGAFHTAVPGLTWTRIRPDGYQPETREIVVDPFRPLHIFALEDIGPPFFVNQESRDGGLTWIDSPKGSGLADVAFDPRRKNRIYGAAFSEVRVSTDGGRSWESSNEFRLGGYYVDVDSVVPDELLDDTVYALTGGRLWRSDDAGRRFRLLPHAFRSRPIVVASRTEGGVVYTALEKHVFRSRDRGLHWTAMGATPTAVLALVADAGVPDTLYAATARGVYTSEDGGRTWHGRSHGLVPRQALTIAAGEGESLYAGTSVGVFRSPGGGRSWSRVGDGPNDSFVGDLGIGPDGRVFASTPGGPFVSDDHGRTWTRQRIPRGTAHDWIVDDRGRSVMWAAGRNLLRSSDGGRTWEAAGSPAGSRGVAALALTRGSPHVLLAGVNEVGLFRSDDDGVHWRKTYGTNEYVEEIVTDPHHPLVAYASLEFGPLLRTNDGGRTWAKVRLPGYRPSAYAMAVLGDGTLIVDTDDALLRSADRGRTWTRIASWTQHIVPGVRLFFPSLAADPRNPHGVFAGPERAVVYSGDSGRQWRQVGSGIPDDFIWSLGVDPAGFAYAGTTGEGVFRLRLG